jgi:3-methyladenine DNA glycosylase Mpg
MLCVRASDNASIPAYTPKKKTPPVSTSYAYLMHAMGTHVDFVKGGKGMSRGVLNVLQAVVIDEARQREHTPSIFT